MPKNSMNLGDRIAKTIPIDQTADTSIEALLKDNKEFRSAISRYPDLIDCARHIEGNLSSAGVHPAGVIVCKDRIDNYIPLRESKGQICSQFDGTEVEELGLLKFDFLALKTLTVVEDSLQMIKDRHNVEIDIDNLEPNDQEVFALLNGKKEGMDNRGIFQFESDGISTLLKSIRVDSFEDMIVANALYRPGPLGAKMHIMYADYKHGRKKINPLHPKMKEILKDTYSIMVYQENFMKIAQELAGFTKGQSDTLRKAVGKKKKELLAAQEDKFIEGCVKNDIDAKTAKKIFEQIKFFGGYGFNRSHSAAYAFLAYQTGYLKVNYSIEFMTALLSSEINNSDKNKKLDKYVRQAREMDIPVKPTSINSSGMKFRIEKGVKNGSEYSFIRPPITMLDGVGEKAADTIVSNQPYDNLEDFLTRVDTSKVTSRVFNSLVGAGSMTGDWGVSKEKLLRDYEGVKLRVTKKKKEIKKQEEYRNQYSGSIFDSFSDGTMNF
jgi:DNA polymerase-3 subunit alpha